MQPMHFSGNIPANYDEFLGPVLFEPYAKDLINRLKDQNMANFLEIACGTGRLTHHLLHILKEYSTLIATDVNADMLEIAKQKINDERVQWKVADGQELPFEADTFDTIVCQYGVMFFPDKLKAFKEAKRVLKNDGLFIFNTWDKMENNRAVEIVNKQVHAVFQNESPDFLEKGPYSFFNQDTIRQLMMEAGFENVQIETVRLKSGYADALNLVKGFTEGSPLSVFLHNKDAAKKEAVYNNTVKELIEQFGKSSDEIYLQALVCTGYKK